MLVMTDNDYDFVGIVASFEHCTCSIVMIS